MINLKPKQGAQSANANAPSHGFYSDRFTLEELALIAAVVGEPSLTDEIWLQRVVNRRLAKLIQSKTITEKSMLTVAAALATGTGRVARLLHDKHIISGETAGNLAEVLESALEEIKRDAGRKASP
jgi:cytosine/adenosine deaminase-related metal-dependent hydrolase